MNFVKILILISILIITLSSCSSPDETPPIILPTDSNTLSSEFPTVSNGINSSTNELFDTILMDSNMQYGSFENPNPINVPVDISYQLLSDNSEKASYLDYTITIKAVYKNEAARDKAKELGENFEPEDYYDELQDLKTHDIYLFYVVLEYRSGTEQNRRDYFDLIDKNGVMQSYSSSPVYRINDDFYENEVYNNKKEGWLSRSVVKGTNPLRLCLGIGDPAVAPGIIATFYFATE